MIQIRKREDVLLACHPIGFPELAPTHCPQPELLCQDRELSPILSTTVPSDRKSYCSFFCLVHFWSP